MLQGKLDCEANIARDDEAAGALLSWTRGEGAELRCTASRLVAWPTFDRTCTDREFDVKP